LKLDRIEQARPRRFAERLDRPPPPGCEAAFPADFGRRFVVFGDAEEEFDWGAPLSRDSTSTDAFALPVATRFFGEHGVVPTYVADWPVVTNPASAAALQAMAEAGACDVGAHLHPWVNPPHEEEVTGPNSFAGALPEPLEAAKLRLLTEKIESLTGRPPLAYRAGRYGVGPNTAALLQTLGYRLDVSVRARFDYRREGGPDFTHHPIRPYWVAEQLLEVPLTTCLAGGLGRWPSLSRSETLRGPLARTKLLNRIPLTPEGVPLAEAKDAIERLLDEGHALFSLSFHTPTVVPGHTPYVRDAEDLRRFWSWWDGVFALFARHGVTPVRSREIYEAAAGLEPC
jgi:peptidoglycan/xylan/chitin deacetylase (PgdA/CDA1 family)